MEYPRGPVHINAAIPRTALSPKFETIRVQQKRSEPSTADRTAVLSESERKATGQILTLL